jgi:hypothetical protein
MNSRRLLFFCLAVVLATATAPALAQPEMPTPPPIWTPTPSPTPTAAAVPGPAATIDPVQTARARAEFDAWRTGTIDRSHYESAFGIKISDADIGQVAAHLRSVGTVTSFTQLQHGSGGGGSNYFIYKIVGSTPPPIAMLIAFDAAGKIDNIAFQPMEATSPTPTPTP